jgi:hypothetical protein
VKSTIRRVAKNVRHTMDPTDRYTLIGRCGEASENIAQILAFDKGYEDVTIVGNLHHQFVYCDRFFIDITLTQFQTKLPQVVLVHFNDYLATLDEIPEWEITEAEAIYCDGTRNIIYSDDGDGQWKL